jgi:hypothetical protein
MIGKLKDLGKLSPLSQNKSKPFKNINRQDIGQKQSGTMLSLKKGKEELTEIIDEIERRLLKY